MLMDVQETHLHEAGMSMPAVQTLPTSAAALSCQLYVTFVAQTPSFIRQAAIAY